MANIRSVGMIKMRGTLQVRTLPKLSVAQLYPKEREEINLNTCGDPDCGNYGAPADPVFGQFVGRSGASLRQAAGKSNPAIALGEGYYTIASVKDEERISSAFNFHSHPVIWTDGRRLVCRREHNGTTCGVGFLLYSNDHYLDEVKRLRNESGALDGPRCGACGKRYLDAPEAFALNGANGKHPETGRPLGLRVIHKDCPAKSGKGRRFTISMGHHSQKDREDNIKILTLLVNGV